MDMILDTNFVISMERERLRGKPGAAHAFLSDHRQDSFRITFTVAAELACGGSAAKREAWERICRPFPIIGWSGEISWQYGEIYRHLRDRGGMIGANDLWIAATALIHGMPVVTNNLSEFSRVPGLEALAF